MSHVSCRKKVLPLRVLFSWLIFKFSNRMCSVDVDELLVDEAMTASGVYSRTDVVRSALQDFIRASQRRQMLRYQGKGIWEGNLNEMRATR
jgi:Arc/MetJ family transcription regulator